MLPRGDLVQGISKIQGYAKKKMTHSSWKTQEFTKLNGIETEVQDSKAIPCSLFGLENELCASATKTTLTDNLGGGKHDYFWKVPVPARVGV